jgi:hypothetical protein
MRTLHPGRTGGGVVSNFSGMIEPAAGGTSPPFTYDPGRAVALARGPVEPYTSPREREQTALAIAGLAADATELRLVLQALGLLAYDSLPRTNWMPAGNPKITYARP